MEVDDIPWCELKGNPQAGVVKEMLASVLPHLLRTAVVLQTDTFALAEQCRNTGSLPAVAYRGIGRCFSWSNL